METTPLADKLREARKQKFATQKAAAEAIGCDETALSFYENGKRVPTGFRLATMCRIYDLPFFEMAELAYANGPVRVE